jgi:hypothetical protein
MVVQDGVVTDEVRATLRWLQNEAGLTDAQLEKYHTKLAELEGLSRIRQGELPAVRTSKLLEGGEICHLDQRCRHRYETAKNSYTVDGELTITSKRILFNSPTRSFAVSPSKVVDVKLLYDSIFITVSGSRGTGHYFLDSPQFGEAILVGVAKRHKYLLVQKFTGEQSRHILDDVKRDVWQRDGGRCVRCRASDYLEFDHIIPHTKGGANTVNNVQILCRRCNLGKGARI